MAMRCPDKGNPREFLEGLRMKRECKGNAPTQRPLTLDAAAAAALVIAAAALVAAATVLSRRR